ncbi:MAG: lipid-binding SYLF domain-containing protein [Gammaproteobacteria bacterium]
MRIFSRLSLTCVSVVFLAACSGWQPGASQADTMTPEVNGAVAKFKAADPSLERFFKEAYGYAIYPSVGKGGFWIGGAYGNGEVFEQGRLIGVTSITQVTVGPQIGGQAYSEIIFFRDKHALDTFTAGNFTFNAQVSAVAATAGAAANADYSSGVAVFTLVEGGLMAEATIGGQKFSFTPLK